MAARRETDKLLAAATALNNPQEDRITVAWALTDAMSTLIALGESATVAPYSSRHRITSPPQTKRSAGPPSRAYAHPRFWAPFIVLGDGAGAAR